MAELRLKIDPRQMEKGGVRGENALRAVKNEAFQTESAVERVGRASIRTGAQLGAMRGAAIRTAGATRNYGSGVQNVAFQLGDFATQVGAGTSASIALGQQLPQLLGGFGVLGAVMGAVVAIAVPLGAAFSKLSLETLDLNAAFPVLSGVLSAFSGTADGLNRTLEFLVENMERAVFIAGTAATFFAGRFVAGMVAARLATLSLSGALVALRAALIRTGIGALIVAAGEMVYQFSRLVRGAGSFGEAMSLLAGVAAEVWERIKIGASLLGEAMGGVAMMIQGHFLSAFASIAEGFASLTSGIAEGINALFGTSLQGAGSGLATDLRSKADYMKEGGAAIASSAMASISDMVGQPIASLDALKDAVKGVDSEFRRTAASADDAGDAASGAGKKSESAAKKAADAAKRLAEETAKVWDNFQQAGGSAIDRLIDGTISLKDALKDMLKEMVRAIAKKNLLRSVEGGTGSDSLGTLIFKGLTGGLKLFDRGGTLPVGQEGIVGEYGPERVASTARGTVITSRADTARMNQGGGRNVTIHVDARGAQAGVAEQIEERLRAVAPQIVGQSVAAVKTNWGVFSEQYKQDGALP